MHINIEIINELLNEKFQTIDDAHNHFVTRVRYIRREKLLAKPHKLNNATILKLKNR